ncbi:GNAT family N-acetyltransferase [Nocardia asteroides]|uniref:GNAT family N-acetyltransferase n=1 Tax=Nocardia asteroides TaxID=1824 RepID=UPI001E4B58DD|nr:GNAT family N-acetyltransferase [Nocardia asteroides]UGT61055.1 GNAT family N-acetyltransferase [Nocardia asteroides]
MTIEIGVASSEAEVEAAAEVFRVAMVGIPPRDVPAGEVNEPGRTLLARVDGIPAGAATAYTGRLVVPGGARVPHAGVTRVGVLPTHARRGIVSALLRRQLADIADRGEVVAGLRATQGGIYERFGYGVASRSAAVRVDTAAARLRPTLPPSGPVRYAERATAFGTLAKIHARLDLSRPGEIDRSPYWWRTRELFDSGDSHVVLHGEPGAEDGFLRYRAADTTDWPRSTGRAVRVGDLVAGSPVALLGLLRHLFALDIAHRVEFPLVATDFPLAELVTDERAVTVTGIGDETWLRLVDVAAALASRGYGPGEPVLLGITDPILPGNSGTFRVRAGETARTAAEPELTADVSALAAAYLGGTPWWHLVLAGRATEQRPGAAAAADALFGTAAPPFSGTFF